jgi:sigma-B regulation protein RsbU (phosphoserine phosphatase)
MTATFTTDFAQEFEAQQSALLRRRFMAYAGVMAALIGLACAVSVVVAVVASAGGLTPPPGASGVAVLWATAGVNVATFAAFTGAYRRARERPATRATMLVWATRLVVWPGAAALVVGLVGYLVARGALPGGVATAGFMAQQLAQIGLTHLIACLFLPWTAREAARPLIPLLALFLAMTVLVAALDRAWVAALWSLPAGLLVGLPGVAWCWWRQGRFKRAFLFQVLRGRYFDMKRELTDARRIHESLFPAAQRHGGLRLDYRYEPMRHIGGDYLYCRVGPRPGDTDGRAESAAELGAEPVLSVLVLDVTGHGIPAALTVNRLYGEVERLFGENPFIGPAAVLRALNRYAHLTLADHSVFITALALRIDPERDLLEYARAGHPPAFLRAVDGTIDQLDSTAPVLGAFRDPEYEIETGRRHFGKGDALIAYTDGAIETRDHTGRMLGVAGLQRTISSVTTPEPGGWAAAVVSAVDRHRVGPPTDDTLVVEVTRALTRAGV